MKYIKIFLALLFISLGASAQYVVRAHKDSVVIGTKYITFLTTKPGMTGMQLTAVKDTGTVAGTVTLERRIDTLPTSATSVWKQVGSQSFTLTNTSSPQGDIFPIVPHDGNSYRFKIVTTGGRCYLYASYLYY